MIYFLFIKIFYPFKVKLKIPVILNNIYSLPVNKNRATSKLKIIFNDTLKKLIILFYFLSFHNF